MLPESDANQEVQTLHRDVLLDQIRQFEQDPVLCERLMGSFDVERGHGATHKITYAVNLMEDQVKARSLTRAMNFMLSQEKAKMRAGKPPPAGIIRAMLDHGGRIAR